MRNIISSILFIFLAYNLISSAELEATTGTESESQIGTCLPKKITFSGGTNWEMELAYDSISKDPLTLLTTYEDGYTYLKEFDYSKQARYTIKEYSDSVHLKTVKMISLGGKGLWKSTFTVDTADPNSGASIVEFGEVNFKQDTIMMSGIYHDRTSMGDTSHTEILVRLDKNKDHISREIYQNGELTMVVFYDGYENRFNPISYVESLSLNYLPNKIYQKETIIRYLDGEPYDKSIYDYDINYNRDLLPIKIVYRLGDEVQKTWEIEYGCTK